MRCILSTLEMAIKQPLRLLCSKQIYGAAPLSMQQERL